MTRKFSEKILKRWKMSDLGAEKWPLCMSEAKKICQELKLVRSFD
jgi:hypothetical protein